MREIKFRIWCDNYCNGESVMFYTDGKTFNLTGDRKLKCCGNNTPVECLSNFSFNKLRQYIGYKDYNKKDIYEGDFVEINSGRIYLIQWEDSGYYGKYKGSDGKYYFQKLFSNKDKYYCTIIGNEYEDSHLMNLI